MKQRMRILLAYDGSDCADAALADLRRAGLPDDAQFAVLSVVEHWLPPTSSLELLGGVDATKEFEALLRRGASKLSELNPAWEVKTELPTGSPAAAIIAKADEWHANLIVVGAHGRTALGKFFFGSVSQNVLHESRCSVRIARVSTAEPDAPARILIGIDGSRFADAAVKAVADRHWPKETEVRLVNATFPVPAMSSDQVLSRIDDWLAAENARTKSALDAATRTLEAAGLKTSVVARDEDPKNLLCGEAASWKADCIFVGSHGGGAVERFLIGSVSSAVAARAACSVEVVRA